MLAALAPIRPIQTGCRVKQIVAFLERQKMSDLSVETQVQLMWIIQQALSSLNEPLTSTKLSQIKTVLTIGIEEQSFLWKKSTNPLDQSALTDKICLIKLSSSLNRIFSGKWLIHFVG